MYITVPPATDDWYGLARPCAVEFVPLNEIDFDVSFTLFVLCSVP